jgi:hypothetical protein
LEILNVVTGDDGVRVVIGLPLKALEFQFQLSLINKSPSKGPSAISSDSSDSSGSGEVSGGEAFFAAGTGVKLKPQDLAPPNLRTFFKRESRVRSNELI